MANGGSGGRLPDTDDPFVLLGIAPDADARTIRQAYARLIRAYRPDRAPVEFQRIHAAFEEVQHATRPRLDHRRRDAGDALAPSDALAPGDAPAQGDALAPGDAHIPDDAPVPTNANLAQARAIARRLDEACALARRGEPAQAAAIVDALLDERVPLDILAGCPEHAALRARHPTLSWTRLARASRDLDAIHAIWSLAWTLARDEDPARAQRLLDDDRLRLDAADHMDLARVCLSWIASLAWRLGPPLEPLVDRLRAAVPMHPGLDRMFDQIGLELNAVAAVRRRTHDGPLAGLPALLAANYAGNRADRRTAARTMLAALSNDVEATLQALEALNRELDLGPLFEALFGHVHVSSTRLDRLAKPTFDRLTGALHEIGREPGKWPLVGGALGGIVLAGVTIDFLAGLGVLVLAVALLAGTEQLRYQRQVRPQLARLVLELPLTTWVLARWVRVNGQIAGRLSRFDMAIDADGALYALSMLAAAAITIGGLDETDPDNAHDPDDAPDGPD